MTADDTTQCEKFALIGFGQAINILRGYVTSLAYWESEYTRLSRKANRNPSPDTAASLAEAKAQVNSIRKGIDTAETSLQDLYLKALRKP